MAEYLKQTRVFEQPGRGHVDKDRDFERKTVNDSEMEKERKKRARNVF